MEILFNNEEQFQPGSFFSIRQEIINGKAITVVKTGNLKDIDNNQVSIINFGKNWTKSNDGYYYYGSKENKTVLEPTSISTSFINSVKFNEKVNASLKESVSEDGKTITYTSTGDGYDNATYTLMVKIETVQHDAANSFWK